MRIYNFGLLVCVAAAAAAGGGGQGRSSDARGAGHPALLRCAHQPRWRHVPVASKTRPTRLFFFLFFFLVFRGGGLSLLPQDIQTAYYAFYKSGVTYGVIVIIGASIVYARAQWTYAFRVCAGPIGRMHIPVRGPVD